tara:strand:- start:5823 stop:6053 length:231 start_codon:yes stop_codon:yes gene_type:complete
LETAKTTASFTHHPPVLLCIPPKKNAKRERERERERFFFFFFFFFFDDDDVWRERNDKDFDEKCVHNNNAREDVSF